MRQIIIELSVIFVSLFCLVPGITAQEWGEISDSEWQMTPPAQYAGMGAMVIFDNGIATTEFHGLNFKRHIRIKVLDENKIDKIDDVVIEYYDYDKLHSVKAQIVRPDGTVLKFDKKSFEKIERGARRVSRFTFPNVKTGDILEYRYGIDYYGGFDKLGPEKYFLFSQDKRYCQYKNRKATGGRPPDKDLYKHVSNLPSWYFDHPVYCLSSTFSAKLGADLDYSYVTTNLPSKLSVPVMERIKVLTATAYKQHTWTVKNIRPFVIDSSMSYSEEVRRRALHFQLFSTVGQNRVVRGTFTDEHWQHIGESFQGYLADYIKKTKKMRKQVKKLVSEAENAQTKIDAICGYVSDRYEIDSTGYELRPSHSNMRRLFNSNYAMPFEANILLVEMLKMAGFKAWPVLISTRDIISFRHTQKFNHMLALVEFDGEAVYLDASARGCPVGSLLPICLVDDGVRVDYDFSGPIKVSAEVCEVAISKK